MNRSGRGVVLTAFLGAGLVAFADEKAPQPTPTLERAPESGGRPQDNFVLQYGETVLPLDQAAADAPRQRRAEDPWIEIASLKKKENRLVIELKVVQGKPEWFSIVLKSGSGRHVSDVRDRSITTSSGFIGSTPSSFVKVDADGTLQIELPLVGERAEAWIEYEPGRPFQPVGYGIPPRTVGIKISRSITIAPVGQLTFSRSWTDAEKLAAEKLRLENAAPPPTPDGYSVIADGTQPLVPGMPILIADAGAWRQSELLAIGKRKLIVAKTTASRPGTAQFERSRCAVASQVLKQAEKDSSKFKPSLRVFPETGALLTKDFELLTSPANLVQGMALLSGQNGECTFASAATDGKLNVRTQFSQGKLQTIDGASIAIKSSDMKRLTDPAFVAASQERYRTYMRLHDREADLRDESEDVKKKLQEFHPNGNRARSYEPLPGFTALTTTELVPARLPVLIHDGSRWSVTIVVEDSPEGRVDVRSEWPFRGQDQRVARKNLYVKAADNPLQLSDQSPRRFTFVVEAEMLPYEIRQVLEKELGVDPLDPALRQKPFKMELTNVSSRLEARIIEYRLLAGGASVSVKEIEGEVKAAK